MKRRNFLASLLALPFAAKPLEALARSDERVSLFGRIFDSHKRTIDANTESLDQLTWAITHNAPSGFKTANYQLSADHARKLPRAFRAEAKFRGRRDL